MLILWDDRIYDPEQDSTGHPSDSENKTRKCHIDRKGVQFKLNKMLLKKINMQIIIIRNNPLHLLKLM